MPLLEPADLELHLHLSCRVLRVTHRSHIQFSELSEIKKTTIIKPITLVILEGELNLSLSLCFQHEASSNLQISCRPVSWWSMTIARALYFRSKTETLIEIDWWTSS